MNNDEELKTLLPGETFKLSTGEDLTIRPVPFGKSRDFSNSVAELIQVLSKKGMSLDSINDASIFNVAFEEMTKLLGVALDKPRAWFDTISISDGMAITEIIVRQNFTSDEKKNLITLVALSLKSRLQTASSSSSEQGIDGQTSLDILLSKSDSSAGVLLH